MLAKIKKFFKDLNGENVLKVVVPIGVVALLVLFYAYGFFVEQPCNGIDQDSLYCALHPFKVADFIGVALFTAAAVFVSGIWSLIWGELDTKSPSKYQWLALAAGVLGILLIWA